MDTRIWPRIAKLSAFALLVLIGLTLLEYLEKFIFVDVEAWQSHLITIVFGTVVASVAAYLALTRAEELGRRYKEAVQLRNQLQEQMKLYEVSVDRLRQLSLAVEQSPNSVLITTPRGEIEYVNRAFSKITGYSREEALGKTPGLLKSGETPADVYHDMWITLKRGEVWRGAMQNRRKDGSLYWDAISIAPVRDADGVIAHYVAIQTDITEQQQMEASLREERNFSNAVLSTSGALMVVLDREGRITRFNRACEDSTGYTFDMVKGQVFWDKFLPAREREAVRAAVVESRASHFPSQFENFCVTRNGRERLVSWHGSAILGPLGEVEYVVLTGIDITDKRQAEDRARTHEAELAHTDRLSLVGEMAAALAHELNQPLTSIYAYGKAALRMLELGQEKSDKFRHALEETVQRAEHAGEIIRHLRGFIRKQAPERRLVSMNEIVEESVNLVSPLARANGVRVDVEMPESAPAVWVDPVQIEQVLVNLMRNSIDAMVDTEGQCWISLNVGTRAQDEVLLTVQDTGPGLDPEALDAIFDPFHTTKPEGLGMGLAISRSIIESHGGRLWAESRPGQGATFSFTLPTGS